MTQLATAPDFEESLEDLQANLPDWWATRDPDSNVYSILDAAAYLIDELSALWEQPYLDQVITTASEQGLIHNFAFAWGVANEELPNVLSQLVAYIQARAAEDGSLLSLVNTLTSLVDTPANTTGGTILRFPASGGLTFPSNGAGLPLYEFAPSDGPTTTVGLIFPPDGSGLTFPQYPDSMPSDNVIVQDGTTPIGSGPGLEFSSNQFVQILPNYATSRMTVEVQSWLNFDRGAFARAVQRFQPADWYPTTIVETTSFH